MVPDVWPCWVRAWEAGVCVVVGGLWSFIAARGVSLDCLDFHLLDW